MLVILARPRHLSARGHISSFFRLFANFNPYSGFLLDLILTRPWRALLPLLCGLSCNGVLRPTRTVLGTIASRPRGLTCFLLSSLAGSHVPLRTVPRLSHFVLPRPRRPRANIFTSRLGADRPLRAFAERLPHLILTRPWHLLRLFLSVSHANSLALAFFTYYAMLGVLARTRGGSLPQLISLSAPEAIGRGLLLRLSFILARSRPVLLHGFALRFGSDLHTNTALLSHFVLSRARRLGSLLVSLLACNRVLRPFGVQFRIIPTWSRCFASFVLCASATAHDPARPVLRFLHIILARSRCL